jgi:ankyrin repeat protein
MNEYGADVNYGEGKGGTALFVAALKGNLPLARCLIEELGANVNQATHDGRTPLMVAS